MMRIRLQRPITTVDQIKKYSIVVIDSKKKRDGKPLDVLGTYTICNKGQQELVIHRKKTLLYMSYGAQFTKGSERVLLPALQRWVH